MVLLPWCAKNTMAPVIRPGDLGIVSRVTCDSQLIWYRAT